MTPMARRGCYILLCGVVLILWIWLGTFDAVEAPYVNF